MEESTNVVESAPIEESSTEPVSQDSNQEVSAQEALPPQEKAKEESKVRKFKVSGQDLEFNLSDEKSIDELIKLAQLGGGARAKMQEASEIKKHYDAIEKMLKENPEELLRSGGIDPEVLAEEIITRRIKEMEKSPEQIEREKIQKELAEARKKLQEVEEQKKNAEIEKLQVKYIQEFNEQITSALENYKELPRSPYTVKRIADTMLWALENGHDVTVSDVVPFVHKEIRGEIQQMVDSLPVDFLEDFIGKNASEKMRQNRLKKMEKPKVTPLSNVKSIGSEVKGDSKAEKKVNMRDFFGI